MLMIVDMHTLNKSRDYRKNCLGISRRIQISFLR